MLSLYADNNPAKFALVMFELLTPKHMVRSQVDQA